MEKTPEDGGSGDAGGAGGAAPRKVGLNSRRRAKTLATLQLLTERVPFLQTISSTRAIGQFHDIVFERLTQLTAEGHSTVALCGNTAPGHEAGGFGSCPHCAWGLVRTCAYCDATLSGRVYPLYVPKFAEAQRLLHVELVMVCSEPCSEGVIAQQHAHVRRLQAAGGTPGGGDVTFRVQKKGGHVKGFVGVMLATASLVLSAFTLYSSAVAYADAVPRSGPVDWMRMVRSETTHSSLISAA
jgi:hypothetical protein